MRRLLLVRHGESEWNADRVLQGQADIGLSEKGRAQARDLAPLIASLTPDRVITSDLVRARETADLLGAPDAEASVDLREIDVGAWTGQPIADIKASAPDAYRGWRAGTFTPPDAENWARFSQRTTDKVLRALGDSERLLVVCHGGVIRALLDALIGLPPRSIIPVGPASLTILADPARNAGAMRLELFNYSPCGPILDAPD